MPTDVYVSRKQITTDFKTIKDTEVVRMIDRDIIEYENILLRNLGSNLSQYTARELADYIEKSRRRTAVRASTSLPFARAILRR